MGQSTLTRGTGLSTGTGNLYSSTSTSTKYCISASFGVFQVPAVCHIAFALCVYVINNVGINSYSFQMLLLRQCFS